jgi:hypothetical protein
LGEGGSGGTAIPRELANSFQLPDDLPAAGAAGDFAGVAAGRGRVGTAGGGLIGRGGSAAGCAPISEASKFQWSAGFGSVMICPNVVGTMAVPGLIANKGPERESAPRAERKACSRRSSHGIRFCRSPKPVLCTILQSSTLSNYYRRYFVGWEAGIGSRLICRASPSGRAAEKVVPTHSAIAGLLVHCSADR